MAGMLPDDNKYKWSSYELPQWPFDDEATVSGETSSRFVIRHLKQGRTGAVKTWPTAAILLNYLVRWDGLSPDATFKVSDDHTLDLRIPSDTQGPFPASSEKEASSSQNQRRYNIVELGGGSGYLSVALAHSLNRQACLEKKWDGRRPLFRPRARILCTDNDGPTLRNMRHNVARQPRENHIPKAVGVELLEWGDDAGGGKFSRAVERHFTDLTSESIENSNDGTGEKDPLCLLTHLIGSDVFWGETTLDPLSSVVSGFKLRNPNLRVILLLAERGRPGAVTDLRRLIEHKVKSGLEALGTSHQTSSLHDFAVKVRNVVHDDLADSTPMKILEC